MKDKLPTRAENYSDWYNELVKRSGLAENSMVRGTMVIKPYGYALWENMQKVLDKMFKDTGHVNAYFPLFVPKSFLEKEEQHAEGFAKECAVVTHHRLKSNPDGPGLIVDPESKLEEELIVRPTSETVIWSSYKNWVQSWRDLPILINQWANVVRWEMRTRLFLRTTEFLWQEGHTAHSTSQEAVEETEKMLEVYRSFVEDYMAVPVVKGVKTESERFAGAQQTYCIEALMQDGKALQAGTSHYLGQNFAKSFDVKFLNKNNEYEFAYATSWGISTRLIGALIMAHSDDQGLVLPPKLAPIQVVIIPVYKNEGDKQKFDDALLPLVKRLTDHGIRVKYDNDDKYSAGYKFAEYELKGVPVRLVFGERELDNQTVEITRRDNGEKISAATNSLTETIEQLLEQIQVSLFTKALDFQKQKTYQVDSWDDFKQKIEQGGFVLAHWDGSAETEAKIKQETMATIRCIPLDGAPESGNCVYSGKPSQKRVLFARAY